MTNTSATRLTALEGLRGLCALSVLVSHLSYDSTGLRTGGASFFPGYIAAFIASFGSIGVLLFFVLSGFVIGTSTKQAFSAQAAKAYLGRRLLRLYPIYFVALLVSFALAHESLLSRSFLIHATFMQTWLAPSVSTNGVLWTLHMEFMFYLLFLAVWSERVSLRVALIVSGACCLVSPFVDLHLLRVLAYFHLWLLGLWASRLRSSDNRPDSWFFWPAVFIGIAANKASAVEVLMDKLHASTDGQISTVSVLMISGALLGPVALLGSATSPRLRLLVRASLLASAASTAVLLAYSLLPHVPRVPAQALAACYLALGGAALLLRFAPPLRPLQSLAWLGSISYAIYIIQNPVEHLVYPLVPAHQPEAVWWAANAAIFALVFAAAWLLELHFHRIVQAAFRRPAAITA